MIEYGGLPEYGDRQRVSSESLREQSSSQYYNSNIDSTSTKFIETPTNIQCKTDGSPKGIKLKSVVSSKLL